MSQNSSFKGFGNSNWNDDEVSEHISKQWLEFQNKIDNINISRHPFHLDVSFYKLHGFSDAYGARIYIKSIENASSLRLLTAKSRVAPIKNVALPRFEFSATVLLSQLAEGVNSISTVNISMPIRLSP